MRARAEEVLDAAWAAGVRWFDAARSYGKAEAPHFRRLPGVVFSRGSVAFSLTHASFS